MTLRQGTWWGMSCWNGLSPEQQRALIEDGTLEFGYVPEGECQEPPTVAIETEDDAAPGPRFYCRACALAYLAPPMPTEVDFAARYWAGDWTEGDAGERRPAWVLGPDDDPIFVWQAEGGEYPVVSLDERGTARLAELRAKGEEVELVMGANAWMFSIGDEGEVVQLSMEIPPGETPAG